MDFHEIHNKSFKKYMLRFMQFNEECNYQSISIRCFCCLKTQAESLFLTSVINKNTNQVLSLTYSHRNSHGNLAAKAQVSLVLSVRLLQKKLLTKVCQEKLYFKVTTIWCCRFFFISWCIIMPVYTTLHNPATWDVFGGRSLRAWVRHSQGKSLIIHLCTIPNRA